MKKLVVLFVLAFSFCAVPAFADTIYFKNLPLEPEYPEEPIYRFAELIYPGTDIGISGWRNGWTETGWFIDENKGALGSDMAPWNWDSGASLGFTQGGQDGIKDPLSLSFYGGAGMTLYISCDYDNFSLELNGSADELITIDLSAYGMIWGLSFYGSGLTPDDAPENIYFVALEYGSRAVPVPAALWLLGSGLAGLGVLRKKIK